MTTRSKGPLETAGIHDTVSWIFGQAQRHHSCQNHGHDRAEDPQPPREELIEIVGLLPVESHDENAEQTRCALCAASVEQAVRFGWIAAEKAAFSVAGCCRALRVSLSGFHAWRQGRRRRERPTLLNKLDTEFDHAAWQYLPELNDCVR